MAEYVFRRRGAFLVLVVFVCLSASGLSACLGDMGSQLYGGIYIGPPDDVAGRAFASTIRLFGNQVGAVLGLLAGIVWSRRMWSLLAGIDVEKLGGRGTKIGMAVGVFATIVLHVSLMIVAGRIAVIELIIGLVFGILAGAILGSFCGAIARWIARASVAEWYWQQERNQLEGSGESE